MRDSHAVSNKKVSKNISLTSWWLSLRADCKLIKSTDLSRYFPELECKALDFSNHATITGSEEMAAIGIKLETYNLQELTRKATGNERELLKLARTRFKTKPIVTQETRTEVYLPPLNTLQNLFIAAIYLQHLKRYKHITAIGACKGLLNNGINLFVYKQPGIQQRKDEMCKVATVFYKQCNASLQSFITQYPSLSKFKHFDDFAHQVCTSLDENYTYETTDVLTRQPNIVASEKKKSDDKCEIDSKHALEKIKGQIRTSMQNIIITGLNRSLQSDSKNTDLKAVVPSGLNFINKVIILLNYFSTKIETINKLEQQSVKLTQKLKQQKEQITKMRDQHDSKLEQTHHKPSASMFGIAASLGYHMTITPATWILSTLFSPDDTSEQKTCKDQASITEHKIVNETENLNTKISTIKAIIANHKYELNKKIHDFNKILRNTRASGDSTYDPITSKDLQSIPKSAIKSIKNDMVEVQCIVNTLQESLKQFSEEHRQRFYHKFLNITRNCAMFIINKLGWDWGYGGVYLLTNAAELLRKSLDDNTSASEVRDKINNALAKIRKIEGSWLFKSCYQEYNKKQASRLNSQLSAAFEAMKLTNKDNPPLKRDTPNIGQHANHRGFRSRIG